MNPAVFIKKKKGRQRAAGVSDRMGFNLERDLTESVDV